MTMLVENVRLAMTSLLANKSRALLTMLGIIIGIASVIAIMTVGNSLTDYVSGSLQSMGANNITVSLQRIEQEEEEREDGIVFGVVERTKEMTEEDYFTDEMIYDLLADFEDSVDAVSVSESVGTVEFKNGGLSEKASVSGVSLGYFLANDMTLLAGRSISAEEILDGRGVIFVSDALVDGLLELEYEEALGVTLQGEVNAQTVEYTIIGVYEEEESVMALMSGSATSCYIPLTTAQSFNHSKNYSSFSVVTKAGMDSDVLAEQIEVYMQGYYRSSPYFSVGASSMASMVSMMNEILDTLVLAIAIVAGIALIVGGIGVMNIMLVSVTERTREIGTRKALGATNESIRLQFIVEAMIMCFIGGLIGVIMGVLLGTMLANYMGTPASPSLSSILVSLGFSLGIGIFFGYYPANKAAKMNPIDALRYE